MWSIRAPLLTLLVLYTDTTTEQPVNELPNQSNQGLVAGVTVTVIIAVIIGAAALTIIVVLVYQLRQRDLQGITL